MLRIGKSSTEQVISVKLKNISIFAQRRSLFDLAKFIQDADGGLMQPVVEGDYEVLVSVMGYLYNVKERQSTTDEMFQPLTDTIQLLKYYDMELSEEVNVLLQVLNESTIVKIRKLLTIIIVIDV